ncbi:hypothetical protein BAUCODRAFT_229759 [Baudoinia panamericana UAMH 10762]|uniref:Uncharacterized protein n=1 Tax=Baudoinia panamericana (strain UAMH 10762) TaxID=717646 RepID=M2MNY5_BAUPA|nr:uncharacterized protein BAUCODRAFT_229759 [Baudoinia panamericana UAMH 10762]EMC93173.1 hypothetical protein BAUCODRAFT_229759 [Baudoinia panamericana UAMH 10762]
MDLLMTDSLVTDPLLMDPLIMAHPPASCTAAHSIESVPCKLFALPRELRDEIYALATCSSLPVYIPNPQRKGYFGPPLAYVCSQMRAEVLPIYFARNTFATNCKISTNGYTAEPESPLKALVGHPYSKSFRQLKWFSGTIGAVYEDGSAWLLDPKGAIIIDVESSGGMQYSGWTALKRCGCEVGKEILTALQEFDPRSFRGGIYSRAMCEGLGFPDGDSDNNMKAEVSCVTCGVRALSGDEGGRYFAVSDVKLWKDRYKRRAESLSEHSQPDRVSPQAQTAWAQATPSVAIQQKHRLMSPRKAKKQRQA